MAGTSATRVSANGKFFRIGEQKFHLKGLSYGPFAPNEDAVHQWVTLVGRSYQGFTPWDQRSAASASDG